MLCTVQQILGKESETALSHAVQLMPGNTLTSKSPGKVFCIGANKTGTTSVEIVFRNLGLVAGNQEQAEMYIHDWAKQDYRRIIKYCQPAQAFQDIPFSRHGTFKVLDGAFPGSKFILTVRNNTDEWYESLVWFHTRIVGKDRVPTAEDLQQFNYRYPGYLLDAMRLTYGVYNSTLYNRDVYINYYESHNSQAIEYFQNRPEDLLVLNLAEADAMERLVKFLGFPYTGQKMPHANSSRR